MDARLVFRGNRMIFTQGSKWKQVEGLDLEMNLQRFCSSDSSLAHQTGRRDAHRDEHLSTHGCFFAFCRARLSWAHSLPADTFTVSTITDGYAREQFPWLLRCPDCILSRLLLLELRPTGDPVDSDSSWRRSSSKIELIGNVDGEVDLERVVKEEEVSVKSGGWEQEDDEEYAGANIDDLWKWNYFYADDTNLSRSDSCVMEKITCEMCPVNALRQLQWVSSTVNELTTCDKVNNNSNRSAETWLILFPVPLITLSPAWRRRRCPEFPSSFLVDSSFLMACFWELEILWWDWFSINFRISVQVIFQCDCSAIVRSSDHRSITSWTVELKTSIWGVSQTLGLRQLVRVMFLCQFARFCTLSFVPSKLFLWFAISRPSQKSVQNSCVILVLCIFLLSTSFPCVVSLIMEDLFFRFSMSNSVKKSLLNHVVRNR